MLRKRSEGSNQIRAILRDYDLGPGTAQGFLHRINDKLYVAIQPDLSESARRALEIEAAGYELRPPVLDNKWFCAPRSAAEVDDTRVKAQSRRIESFEPEWIDEVKDLWIFYRDYESVVYWSGLEPEPVLAILRLLWSRGEIPSEDT